MATPLWSFITYVNEMKLKILLSGAFLLLSVMTADAVPAKPVKKTVRQADGTTIELTLRGDEHFMYYTDAEGTPYLLHADGRLERKTDEEITDTWTTRRAERLSVVNRMSQNKARTKAGKPSNATTGKHRGLVILVDFPDFPFASENPQEAFDRFFNEKGYNEYGNTGSVRDYFLRQSYGQLEIDFDVVGPYTTLNKLSYYGEHAGNSNDANPAKMVTEAIDAAAADVNYANYDWDDDGEVDQIFLICAGYDEAEGADAKYIWPHEWALAGQNIERTYNGKVLNTYGVSTELWGNDNSNPNKEMAGIGAACHEFSHCLGLPDFYDTSSGRNFGMGPWDVMCSGNYNNNSRTPAAYTSYERMFAGWMTPTELTEMTRIEGMKPLEESPEAYILYNDNNKNEFFLLENRQKVGFDAGLYGHGLLVLHVYYDNASWSQNVVNNVASLQRMTIIPADGSLVNTLTSLAGDPFPGTSGNDMLTNYSNPAATLYVSNADGSKLMGKPIDNIKESEDGLISFVACRPELGIPEPGEGVATEGKNEFTVSWPAVSGAIGYELELTEIGKASDNPEEALEREFTFDQVKTSSVGLTDISTKLPNYGMSGWAGEKLYTSPNKLRLGTSTVAGYLKSPTWRVPQSSEMTIVMGAKPYKEGTPVNGQLKVAFGNSGEKASYETLSFQVTEEEIIIFHVSVRKDLYWLEIRPETCMYLNYLAIYDGTWNEEQLGIASQSASRQMTPRKATVVTNYTTDTNTFTFKDLNVKSRFFYRVRTRGEENIYSQWSKEKGFTFSGNASEGDVNGDGDVNVADVDSVIEAIGEDYETNKAADINGDGDINVADVDFVIERIK